MLNWSLFMLWSRLFIPTLRETPGAEDPLLVRAGYARQVAPRTYSYLLLGRRSLERIGRLVRQEMEWLGGQQMQWTQPHHEAIAAIARGGLRSYRQLPQTWCQTGIVQHDSFSFDLDRTGLDVAHGKHQAAFVRVLTRCGIQFRTMGTLAGAHFVAEAEGGEDTVAVCDGCGYRALHDEAVARPTPPPAPDPPGDLTPEQFHTPDCKTIAALSKFTGLPDASQMKSLVWMAGDQVVLALLRGDHQLSESKFSAVVQDAPFRPARPEEIRAAFGADAGSLGPVGLQNVTILADHALQGRRNMIGGANRNDYHLRHVTPGEDFQAAFHDLRMMEPGDTCGACGAPLEIRKALDLGHVSKLGWRRAESLGLHVTNVAGQEIVPALGSYGLALNRILLAAAGQYCDKDGLRLPPAIAPFTVVVTPVNMTDAAQRSAGDSLYQQCQALGLDALLDDRDERPGVKLKDADLIGVPFRITIGKKLAQGVVELVERGRKFTDVSVTEAATAIAELLRRDDGT